MRRLLITLLAILVMSGAAISQKTARHAEHLHHSTHNQTPTEIERLAALGKLWGVTKYFHPYLAYRKIDWDAALVAAIPKVRAATTTEEFVEAMQGMLTTLDDPATKLYQVRQVEERDTGADLPTFRRTEDNLLIISITTAAKLTNRTEFLGKLVRIRQEMPSAGGIVFDLRATAPNLEGSALEGLLSGSGISSRLSPSLLITPGKRRRLHFGFPPEEGGPSDIYQSALTTVDGQRYIPSPGTKERPIVFLINQHSDLPILAPALQAAGKCLIVAEGETGDGPAVEKYRLRLVAGIEANIRLSELVHGDGTGGFQPDRVVFVTRHPAEIDAAAETALALARNFTKSVAQRSLLPARAVQAQEHAYQEMRYPAVEYRLLAAFKFWSVIEHFYPYKDLMGEDWDAVLREFIPRLLTARNAQEYHLTIAEMVTRIHDGHGFARSDVLTEYWGAASPPIRTRIIEGIPVVTRLLDPSAVSARIKVGDVILRVDGQPAKQRIEHYAKYIPVSTPQALPERVARTWLSGPEQTSVSLTVRDRLNRTKEVKLLRKSSFERKSHDEREGEILKLLPSNIGYADLDRMTLSMVDEMFERFKDTRAIIFDMRGYPNLTAWAIAPRLAEKEFLPMGLVQQPLVMSPEDLGSTGEVVIKRRQTDSFTALIPPTSKPSYKGQTVMLIDERTQSQAEATAMFFKAANQTSFIGSPTSGANGDTTNLYVPGGILIRFTGLGTRLADGRQLQRVGLLPDLLVKPTILGIQSEKDEVLDKALVFLRKRGRPQK